MTRTRRAAAAVVVAAAAFLLGAGPALAHAELRSTEPASSAVLDTPPHQVVLRFSEAVEVSLGAVRVFDGHGARLHTGAARHPDGHSNAVAVDLPHLPDGGYVVTWRVVSADSHPVHGAFTFHVGAATTGDLTTPTSEGGSTAVGVAYGIARFLAFLGLAVVVGASFFVVALWPAGWQDRRVRRVVWSAWAAVTAATIAGLGLQGAHAAGLPLADAVRLSVWADVLRTRFGHVWAARLVLLAVAVPMVRARRRLPAALVGVGALLVLTPGLSGHAGTGSAVPLALAVDWLHVAAVSVWFGGLVVLPLSDDAVLARFSRVALAAVSVILVTGTIQGWRQTGSVDALKDTTYGRLLLAKLALFAVIVALASVSRSWVRRRRGTKQRFRQAVVAETAVAVLVLAVTSLLVQAEPARSALAKPFSTELSAGNLLVDVTLDPAKAGPADLHVYVLSKAGAVQEVADLTASLRLPDRGIGPLAVPLLRAGPGHFSAYGFDLPLPGHWQLDVAVRTGDVDEARATTRIDVH